MVMEIILDLLEIARYGLQIGGTALSSLGALIVRYPDMPEGRLRTFVARFVTRSQTLTKARDEFHDSGRITDENQVRVVEDVFEQRYGRTGEGEPEQVRETSTSIRIEYPDNKISNGFKERESGRLEKRLFFDWGRRRLTTQTGMKYIAAGFVLLLAGTLLSFPLI